MPKLLFQEGNPGKPKGAISKKIEFERFLFDNFITNKDKAELLLNAMYLNKVDFKWLMGLLAERMPKEAIVAADIVTTDRQIIIEIEKNAQPETQRLSTEVLSV